MITMASTMREKALITIGVDPGRVTGWAFAVEGRPMIVDGAPICGYGPPEQAAKDILAELAGNDEPVRIVFEAAFQGRFGAGVSVAYTTGFLVGLISPHLVAGSEVIRLPATQWRSRLWPGKKFKRDEAKRMAAAYAFDETGDESMKRPSREHVAEAVCIAIAMSNG